MFNVEKFAEEVVARLQDSRRILHEIHAKSSFLDQDALNLAFRGRWEELPARFNYMSIDQSPLDLDSGYILHATGSRKPWMLGGRHRYSAEYREEMVAMSVPVVQRQEIRWIADRAARRFLNVIGRH